MKTVITMDPAGGLTIPEAARRAHRVEGAALFEPEVVDQTLVLRPDGKLPEEDAWAYTPEHIKRVNRTLHETGGRRMSPAALEQLIADAES